MGLLFPLLSFWVISPSHLFNISLISLLYMLGIEILSLLYMLGIETLPLLYMLGIETPHISQNILSFVFGDTGLPLTALNPSDFHPSASLKL